jgi:hypothetical protein
MPVIHVSIPESRGHLYIRLREIAQANDCGLSHVVCEAIQNFVENGYPQVTAPNPNTLVNRILDTIETLGGATPNEIAQELEENANTVRATLANLKNRDIVEKPEPGRNRKWFVKNPRASVTIGAHPNP